MVVGSWLVCGRGGCRWCGLCACSMTWFVRWPRCGSPRWSWLVSMVRTMCVFEGVRGCGRVCWLSSRSPGCLLVDDFCVFKGVAALSGRRLGRRGRLGCLLVDDFCGAGVGLSSVRGCGLRWWLSSRSSRCLRVVASRVGEAAPRWCEAAPRWCEAAPRWCEAAPRWCEAAFEAVGRWRDTERCVIVTQHVVGWGGKHPHTHGKTHKNTKGCKKPDTLLTHAAHENTPVFEDAVDDFVAAAVAEIHGMSVS